ncbi:MAG: hypothetical protein NXI24_11900 [bacterium]|nr:hypothetical protein [bacterium]
MPVRGKYFTGAFLAICAAIPIIALLLGNPGSLVASLSGVAGFFSGDGLFASIFLLFTGLFTSVLGLLLGWRLPRPHPAVGLGQSTGPVLRLPLSKRRRLGPAGKRSWSEYTLLRRPIFAVPREPERQPFIITGFVQQGDSLKILGHCAANKKPTWSGVKYRFISDPDFVPEGVRSPAKMMRAYTDGLYDFLERRFENDASGDERRKAIILAAAQIGNWILTDDLTADQTAIELQKLNVDAGDQKRVVDAAIDAVKRSGKDTQKLAIVRG